MKGVRVNSVIHDCDDKEYVPSMASARKLFKILPHFTLAQHLLFISIPISVKE